jgi:hypothetical protein
VCSIDGGPFQRLNPQWEYDPEAIEQREADRLTAIELPAAEGTDHPA